MKLNYTDNVLETAGRVHWQDLIESEDDILTFVKKLEQRTGLKFMAHKEMDTLNGFVTKLPVGYIVSIYGVDKNSDKEGSHIFKSVKVSKEMENKIYASL